MLFVTVSIAQTNLSGDISGMILNKMGSPYIVSKDIFISGDEETVIKAGTVLLFNSFTGLTIFGNLFVEGTNDQQVIFTSINDSLYNKNADTPPETFDWNGISVENSADNVKLRNFSISYSVYGIKCQKKNIILVNGIFKNNGQFNFTIDNKIMMVDDKISYSYNTYKKDKVKPTLSSTKDTVVIQTGGKAKRKLTPKQKKLRFGAFVSLGTGAVSGIGSIVCFVYSDKNNTLYGQEHSDQNKMKEYKDNYFMYKNAGIATAVVSGLTLATSAVFYFFYINNKSEKPKTNIKISLDFPEDNLLSGNYNKYEKAVWGLNIVRTF